jgi:hypothetical protein
MDVRYGTIPTIQKFNAAYLLKTPCREPQGVPHACADDD